VIGTRAFARAPVDPDGLDAAKRASIRVLRWVLGGAGVDVAEFHVGFGALPPNLRPLAADFALRHLAQISPDRRAPLTAALRLATVGWMARSAIVRDVRVALGEAGIPFVFLKGVALAEQVYARPATRTSSDVDVWIRPTDLPAAETVLRRTGFVVPPRFDEPSEPVGPSPVAYLEKSFGGVPVPVEVHVRPHSLRALTDTEVDDIWSSRMSVGPTALPVLPLDHQLLHLCLHVARSHAFVGGLRTLVDVAMVVSHWPGDDHWTEFSRRAIQVRAAPAVWVCLTLSRELVGANVPRRVTDDLGGGLSRDVVDRARDLLWSRDPKLPSGTTRLLGGLDEAGWLRNRLRLRRLVTAEGRGSMPRSERPPLGLVARYFWRRLHSLSGVLLRGEALAPSFWKRVGVERRRNRLARDLDLAGDRAPRS
jgi:hypothetical protein